MCVCACVRARRPWVQPCDCASDTCSATPVSRSAVFEILPILGRVLARVLAHVLACTLVRALVCALACAPA